MMCEHEFVQEEWIVEVCKKCDKLRVQTVFEAELAAAKAELAAEVERMDSLICKLKTCRTCNFVMADRCDKHDRLIDNPMREKCDDWQLLEKEA